MAYFHDFNPELLSSNAEDYVNERDPITPNSSIYKGTFRPLQVSCAVRVATLGESKVKLYENELHIDRLTSHPNLMKMLCHFFQGDRTWFTIFPYSPFKSLDKLCQPFGLPEAVIAFAMADILKAVDYLHHNNIIHRFV